MNPDQWSRAKELFHQALERPARDRSGFLSTVCNGAVELRAEVDRLLAAHQDAGDFLERENPSPDHEQGTTMSDRRAPMTGRVIGRYEVGRLLGVGGMGEVYVARDPDLRRDVALKVAATGDSESQTRLRREARHASQLNHPHICTMHEVGTSDGLTYIVMELVEGELLSALIANGGLPIETALRYGIQISDALAHAHDHGVSHRDLKSANVVIARDGRAKVLDFGLARRLPAARFTERSESASSNTADGYVSGTLAYIAPELLRGEQADAQSDIWSLGVVLYEMVTGRRPFEGATSFELSASILREPPAPLPNGVPVSLGQVIRRCLAKDRRDRYARAEDVRAALEAIQGHRVEPARHGSRRWIALTAAIAVSLALAVAFGWRMNRGNVARVAVGAGGRPAIAVMPFENSANANQDDAWMSRGVPSMLLTGLAQTSGLDIVSMDRVQAVVKQMGNNDADAPGRHQAEEIARRAGAGAVVVGSIFKAGAEYRIDAQLEDLSSGRVLAAGSVRGSDLFALVDQLASKIRDGAGIHSSAEIRSVADVSSSSLDAYRLYSEGLDAYVNARLDEAQKLLEAAVARDPNFAQAYLTLSSVTFFQGHVTAHSEYLRKASAHADRLNERERLLVEVETAREAGDGALSARLIDQLISRFPDEEKAYPSASLLYEPMDGLVRPAEKLLPIVAIGIRTLPRSSAIRVLNGYALLNVGRAAEALEEFKLAAEYAPREPNPYDSMGEAHLVMGEPAKAIELYTRALIVDPTFPSDSNIAWARAMMGDYKGASSGPDTYPFMKAFILSRAGRYRDAESVLSRELKLAQTEGAPERVAGVHFLMAIFAIEQRALELALNQAAMAEESLASLPPSRKRRYLVVGDMLSGIAELRLGHIDRAKSRFDLLTKRYAADHQAERWWRSVLQAEIALASGDGRQAIRVYEDAEAAKTVKISMSPNAVTWIMAGNLPFRDGVARAQAARGDLARATDTYRKLLTLGPHQKWMGLYEPRYVLEIARLLDRAGDQVGARSEYQRFLHLWEDADSDLAELEEAKRGAASR